MRIYEQFVVELTPPLNAGNQTLPRTVPSNDHIVLSKPARCHQAVGSKECRGNEEETVVNDKGAKNVVFLNNESDNKVPELIDSASFDELVKQV